MRSRIKDHLLRIRWWLVHLNRRQLHRWVYKATRPASYPYISGDGFRRMAQHIFDETNRRLRPEAVHGGDVVFVQTDFVVRFFREIDPGIHVPYRLVTHNSDTPVDSALTKLITDNVKVWFAQNNTMEHERVVPIPIGLENLHHYHAGVPHEYNALRGSKLPRSDRVLAGFTISTNPVERQRAHEIASEVGCVDQLRRRLSQPEYLKMLVTYRFLLSPPGNGLDTHRTWEAMYLGVVPIVKDSVAMRAFEGLGLPLWRMENWEELLRLTETQLRDKYDELQPKFDAPALRMNYWQDAIQSSLPRARGLNVGLPLNGTGRRGAR